MPKRETPFVKETASLVESAEKLRQKLEGELKVAHAHAQQARIANENIQITLDRENEALADALEHESLEILRDLDRADKKEKPDSL